MENNNNKRKRKAADRPNYYITQQFLLICVAHYFMPYLPNALTGMKTSTMPSCNGLLLAQNMSGY